MTGCSTGRLAQGYEIVHSMKSKPVMVTPEERYTIHVVGLSPHIHWEQRCPLSGPVCQLVFLTHKGKDGKSETRYQYHKESLRDLVFCLGLLKAYDGFKVSLSPSSLLCTHTIRKAPLLHFRIPVTKRKKHSTA